jgi:hypothetical protein
MVIMTIMDTPVIMVVMADTLDITMADMVDTPGITTAGI